MKYLLIILAVPLFGSAALTQQTDDAQAAFCRYATEQASAERDLLRSPSAIAGPIQPSSGTPAQIVLGITNSLADDRKSSLVMQAARTNCLLYRASVEARQHIYYALPTIEKDVLRHRLELIREAAQKLDSLIAENVRLVQSQNMTRSAVYYLQAARVRLDTSRTATLTGIASPYVPELSKVPLRQLIGEKLLMEESNQKAVTKLQKENGWDVKLSGGARRQLGQMTSNSDRAGLFGEFSVTYDLGRHSAGKHLDNSVAAYTDWKRSQFDDVSSQAAVMKQQITDTITIQEEQLKTLSAHDAQIDNDLKSLTGVETSNALSFRNQLIADQTILRVDIGDVQFRLDRLRAYLAENF